MSEVFVGVDSGGSKTLAVVVDAAGNELSRKSGAGANYAVSGLDWVVHTITSVVSEALSLAGITDKPKAAWLGIAGTDRPEDYDALYPALSSVADKIKITNDGDLGLCALRDNVGIAIIAGTGAIAVGVDVKGKRSRTGGWGHIIGDEGSGYDIGRRGLQAAVRMADGRGVNTSLLDKILHKWSLHDPSEIIPKVYHNYDKALVASVAEIVFEAAAEGDQASKQIIADSIREIALLALPLARRLEFPNGEVPLALCGGLLVGNTSFREGVLDIVSQHCKLGQVEVVQEPALAAARAARNI